MEKTGIKTIIGELNRAIRQFNQMFISLKESIQWMKKAYEEMKVELDRRQKDVYKRLILSYLRELHDFIYVLYAIDYRVCIACFAILNTNAIDKIKILSLIHI